MTYPLGYPVASSATAPSTRNDRGCGPTSPTKDPRPSRRLSPRRLAAISARLSDRDQQILETVDRFRVMSGAQLTRLFWPNGLPTTRARLARHSLSRLVHLGVLTPLARRIGGVRAGSAGLCFAVGLAGQRLLTPTPGRRARSPHTPGERYLRHHLAVGQFYVELVEAERRREAELLAVEPEPECWRTFTGSYGIAATLKPDAYLKFGIGEYEYSWLVEIDRATEALSTIFRKAQRHLDYHRSGAAHHTHGVLPRVLWIVPDPQRAQQMRHALDRLPDETRALFAITTATTAAGFLVSEAHP